VNSQTLPEWYSKTSVNVKPCKRRRLRSFVLRGLAVFVEALASEVASSDIPNGWLRRIEPRAKIIGFFILIFGMTFIHELVSLAILLGLAILVAISAKISPIRLARVWVGVPLFSLAIVLPATINFITPGRPVLTLWQFEPGASIGSWNLPEALTVTLDGLIVAARFLLRSTDAVVLAFILVATTGHSELLSGLRRLGMPQAFGMVLVMAERYLSVLLRVAEEIHLVKLSRTISPGSLGQEHRWVAAGIGNLFRKTRYLTEDVYNAMLSRGFDGEVRVISSSRISILDVFWVLGAVLALIGLLLCDRLVF
jgi:cobalt/nickel transport system permease protein